MREKKPKKVKGGLVPDKDLSVVTNAGFIEEKRERSINRRAGLHDKKKNLDGEKRIYRRKPLALKHKRRMRKAAAALSAVFVGCIAFVGYGFIFKKPVAPLGDGGYKTVCLELPADGLKPTSYTAVECVGYMNYALMHQQSWSSEFHATVNAMGLMSQSVSTYKQYYDSVLVSADITTSSMVNNARQFCVADGRVIWREASGGKNTYAAMDTPWSEKLSGNYTLEEFRDKRGFPPTEFSVYVINEKTVLEEGTSQYAVDNGDGTYSVTLHLNCISPEPGNESVNETSAVYYYVRQMLVTGGLTDYPVFKDVQITYTFDENWRVLSSEVSENYAAVMGISANCSSDSLTEYSYDTEEYAKVAVEKYYEGFFKQHMATTVTPDDGAVTSAMCLSNAFGSVLTEGAVFRVGAKIDGLDLNGVVSLDMVDGTIGDLRVKFGDVAAYYGVYDGKDTIYISAGGSKIKLLIDDLISGSKEGGMLDGIDTDALLEQLGGGDFKINQDGTKATLSSTLDIFDLKISLVFTFNIEGKNVALDNLNATVPIGEKIIRATLSFGTVEDKPNALTEGERAQFIDVINDGFTLGGKAELSVNGVNIALDINEFSIKLNDGISFKLGAQLKAADRILDIYVAYLNGKITAVYGDSSNNVGVTLNIKDGDLKTLSAVFEDALARIRAVIDEIVNKDVLAEDKLTSLENELESAGGLANVLAEVIAIFGLPTDENGSIDVLSLINSIYITNNDGKAVIGLGQNIAFTIGINQSAVNLGLEFEIANATASVGLKNLRLSAYSDVDCPATEDSLITVTDIADMIDTLCASIELIGSDALTVTADVATYEKDEKGVETKTRDIDIRLEYNRGENGFPVHFDLGTENTQTGLRDNINFWLDSTMYLRLKADVIDAKNSKNNIYIDLSVLDANPASTSASDGKTQGKYTTDGKLDLYLMISRVPSGEVGYNPMMLYVPVEDLLTMVAMGGAMLNLEDLNVQIDGEQFEKLNKELNSVFAQVANIVDKLLVDNYLDGQQSQFASIGGSIVEQILRGQKIEAKNLSELLNLILNSLVGKTCGVIEETSPAVYGDGNFIKALDVIKEASGEIISLKLNSSAVYGRGTEKETSFNICKNFINYGILPIEYEADGEAFDGQTVTRSYISSVRLNNIYYGDNLKNRLDIDVGISFGAEKPLANSSESFKNYRNFSNVSTLIKAFVNSATHKVEDENSAPEDAAVYALNSHYYIDGYIELYIKLFGQNVGAKINIDTFFVTINDDNTVEFNLSINYKKVSIPFFTMIDTDASVDLTIKDDMIYVRKSTDGKKTYTYRVMTIKDFSADMMNQLQFILSLSDQLRGMMDGGSGGGSGSPVDFGDYLDTYLANYNFLQDGSSAVWTLAINNKAINELAGMNNLLSESVTVKFNATQHSDKTYSLNSLTIGSKLFGILQLDGNLNYRNPQNVWDGGEDLSGNAVDLAGNKAFGVDGYSWTEVLGGTKFEDIQKTVNWNKLLRDTSGKNYIQYSGSEIHMGTLKFEYSKNVYNNEFEEIGERKLVLYGGNNTVYTLLEYPSLEAVMPPQLNDTQSGENDYLVGVWSYNYTVSDKAGESDIIVLRAAYDVVTVKIISSQLVEGGVFGLTDYISDDDYGYVYYKTFKYGDTVEFKDIPNLKTYSYNGLYDFATGERVRRFEAITSATFYLDWQGKQIDITYKSDKAVNGAAEKDGIYTLGGTVRYGDDYKLRLPSLADESSDISFLGWFADFGNSYEYISDYAALKIFVEKTLTEKDSSANVTLSAVWVYNVKVTISSSSYSWFTLKASGFYEGGSYAEGISSQIAADVNMSYSAGVKLCSSSDGVNIAETWDKKFKNGNSFDIYNSASKNTSYAGAQVTVTYSVHGNEISAVSNVAFKET